ncbi:KEOPS complex subunit Cgi121, partial [Halarchaeum acidiphilum]
AAEAAAANAVAERVGPGGGFDARDEERIRDFFEIGDAELAATDASLEALVCERVALLDVEK